MSLTCQRISSCPLAEEARCQSCCSPGHVWERTTCCNTAIFTALPLLSHLASIGSDRKRWTLDLIRSGLVRSNDLIGSRYPCSEQIPSSSSSFAPLPIFDCLVHNLDRLLFLWPSILINLPFFESSQKVGATQLKQSKHLRSQCCYRCGCCYYCW